MPFVPKHQLSWVFGLIEKVSCPVFKDVLARQWFIWSLLLLRGSKSMHHSDETWSSPDCFPLALVTVKISNVLLCFMKFQSKLFFVDKNKTIENVHLKRYMIPRNSDRHPATKVDCRTPQLWHCWPFGWIILVQRVILYASLASSPRYT